MEKAYLENSGWTLVEDQFPSWNPHWKCPVTSEVYPHCLAVQNQEARDKFFKKRKK